MDSSSAADSLPPPFAALVTGRSDSACDVGSGCAPLTSTACPAAADDGDDDGDDDAAEPAAPPLLKRLALHECIPPVSDTSSPSSSSCSCISLAEPALLFLTLLPLPFALLGALPACLLCGVLSAALTAPAFPTGVVAGLAIKLEEWAELLLLELLSPLLAAVIGGLCLTEGVLAADEEEDAAADDELAFFLPALAPSLTDVMAW